MAKDYNVLAKSIVELVGGEENVVSLAHCVTRLQQTKELLPQKQ